MSSLAFNVSSTLAFPEKFRALDREVRDPLASPSPSFDWADDVEQEFYSGDDSNSDLDEDDKDDSPAVDRAYSSGPRSFRGSGFSLGAISEEDENEDEDEDEDDTAAEEDIRSGSTATDSTTARGLLDTDRMFASGRPARGHRRYRVASVPSLWAIKEDDEDSDADGESLNLVANDDDIDSLRSSRTCVAHSDEDERGLAADDSDSDWVWVDAGEVDKAARWTPVSSTDARLRPSHSRLRRVSSWFKTLCGLRGKRAPLRR